MCEVLLALGRDVFKFPGRRPHIYANPTLHVCFLDVYSKLEQSYINQA